jgi:diamine N-acetyltransferase
MNVKLVEVVRDNFNDVIELEFKETQKEYVTSNLYSIAESTFSTSTHLRAIYLDDKVVGFLEYQFGETGELDEDECTLWRFMIDRKCQNTGIGKIAMGLLLEEIKAHGERCKFVDVYYHPQNIAAKKLYVSYGFKEVGDRDDGTVIGKRRL